MQKFRVFNYSSLLSSIKHCRQQIIAPASSSNRPMSSGRNIDSRGEEAATANNPPAPMAYTETDEPDLWSVPTTLPISQSDGKKKPAAVTVNAVYQDTHPNTNDDGSAATKGTVVFTHGSPGSHKDFKYIVPLLRHQGVRCVAINWPGMGYSGYDHRLCNNNAERTAFAQAILDRLQLRRPLIFVGHSRGAENALRLAALNKDKTIAALALNFVGLRKHKGVRPWWVVVLTSALWEWSRFLGLQPLLAPVYKALYNVVGLRTPNGHIVGRCLATMRSTDFNKQLPVLTQLLADPRPMRLLFAYSGQDFLVETECSRELLAAAMPQCKELATETQGEEEQIIVEMRSQMQAGHKQIAVFFANEDHFLQKHRPRFLAQSILELFALEAEAEKQQQQNPSVDEQKRRTAESHNQSQANGMMEEAKMEGKMAANL